MKATMENALIRLAQRHRTAPREGVAEALSRSLHAIRTHLDMDVAFISEFAQDRRFFRYVDSADQEAVIRVGNSDPLAESYCQRVVDGRLPELMVDACLNDEALTLSATRALPVRAHLSVPIRLKNGRLFGTLCCFSSRADHSLTGRDLAMLRVMSDMVADQIEADLLETEARLEQDRGIAQALAPGGMRTVFQPIFSLEPRRVVGLEALTRFPIDPPRPPDQWFAEAAARDRGVEFELHAIQLALQALPRLPPGLYLSVNASPNTVMQADLAQVLARVPLERIVLEVTEHEEVEQYAEIADVIRPLRRAGLRVAVDDAGAGYACFKHILNLAPDVIKLDVSITRGIDTDFSRQALAAALVSFAQTTQGQLVAEGAETLAELDTLRSLGITLAQGYALARPMALDDALALARELGVD